MEALLCSLSPSCLWAWLPKVVFSLSAAHFTGLFAVFVKVMTLAAAAAILMSRSYLEDHKIVI